MPIIKLGEAHEIRLENAESCIPDVSAEVLENFRKFAANLKKVAPRAEDFLYFSAVMMHAAEAAALNEDGTPKLNAKGEEVQVGWDKSGNTWKWTTNDSNIKPYKNSNGDIFPEEELIKAYKKWKHKPLCVDHKSSSVDHVRGFIVDTYYDRGLKRVVALCALDKVGWPQLARQISTRTSNCVSMGTAVGRAICYDCGRVARVESDFCNHMKNKTCYGEINTDLNPIELSIVMNGADQKATIKNIIAAANTMNTYLENRAKELDKLAELAYSATISVHDGGDGDNKSQQISINATNLSRFKTEIEEAFDKLQEFKTAKISAKDTNDLASNQSSGSIAMDDSTPETDSGLALQTPQTVRFASSTNKTEVGEPIAELQAITVAIESTLNQMKTSLDKLAKSTSTKQEEHMSGSDKLNKQGYFQGAGGVNEPTPGQVKYPKDPLNEQLREHEDKQMTGQPPFPEVGPVDGMHPSPASADPSNELERKKMLARAESEERQLKRDGIVQLAKQVLQDKRAYWLGGGGVNEPTPGKPKYPKDKLNEELREYEDKQMTGQPPFPGVGPVDGLHPSPSSADPKDELKRKEMLARAGLSGRFNFHKDADGKLNKAKSAWNVFLGDKLLLTASVDDLCGGHVSDTLYDTIASKPFGAQLLEKVKANGAEAVSKLFKKAQAALPPAGDAGGTSAPPMAGGDAAGGTSAPAAGESGPPVEDDGKSGDPSQHVLQLSDKVRDEASDLAEAVKALMGERAEMGGAEAAPASGVGAPAGGPAAAMADDNSKQASNFGTATLNTLRKELNAALTHAMKESIAELNEHKQELDMIAGMYDKGSITNTNKELVGPIVEDAINEAKTAMADGFKLMQAFVKYARGTKAIVKRAEIEAELQALAEGDSTMGDKKDSHSADGGGDLMGLINDTNADLDAVHEMMGDHGLGDLGLEGLLDDEPKKDDEGLEGLGSDDNDGITVDTPQQAAEVATKAPNADINLKQAAYSSRQGRALLRAKLAADATGKEETGEVQDASKLQFSDMLDQADGLANGQTQLDVKPSQSPGPSAKFPLGLVETPEESLKAMMEVAKAPPKVRKEAEAIQKLVVEGKIAAADVDELAAYGLDKDAIAYWKKYFGEVDGGGEFASELVKEHVKATVEEELNKFRVKLARAFETAYDMVERGMCRSERSAISNQVDELMKFSDDNFEALKRVIARHEPMHKQAASRVPQVGLLRDNEGPSTPAVLVEEDDYAQLSSMFGNKKGVF